jgi:hypothetical protein
LEEKTAQNEKLLGKLYSVALRHCPWGVQKVAACDMLSKLGWRVKSRNSSGGPENAIAETPKNLHFRPGALLKNLAV